MKKIILTVGAMMAVTALWARPQVTVVQAEKVPLPRETMAQTPVISPDGMFAVIQSGGSLQRVELSTGLLQPIVETPHAFEIAISADGTKVAYLEADYKDMLRYVSVKGADVATGKTTTVVKPSREVGTGLSIASNTVNAVEKQKQKVKSLQEKKTKAPVATINYGHLDVTVNGRTTTIDPQGPGSYLWPSVSPDGTKIVYWCSGLGCFVCDLDGKNARPIGELRAARWAGNDMLVGMTTRDNGYVTTESVVRLSDLNGEMIDLTERGEVAMMPTASADGTRVLYTDGQGALYFITLKR